MAHQSPRPSRVIPPPPISPSHTVNLSPASITYQLAHLDEVVHQLVGENQRLTGICQKSGYSNEAGKSVWNEEIAIRTTRLKESINSVVQENRQLREFKRRNGHIEMEVEIQNTKNKALAAIKCLQGCRLEGTGTTHDSRLYGVDDASPVSSIMAVLYKLTEDFTLKYKYMTTEHKRLKEEKTYQLRALDDDRRGIEQENSRLRMELNVARATTQPVTAPVDLSKQKKELEVHVNGLQHALEQEAERTHRMENDLKQTSRNLDDTRHQLLQAQKQLEMSMRLVERTAESFATPPLSPTPRYTPRGSSSPPSLIPAVMQRDLHDTSPRNPDPPPSTPMTATEGAPPSSPLQVSVTPSTSNSHSTVQTPFSEASMHFPSTPATPLAAASETSTIVDANADTSTTTTTQPSDGESTSTRPVKSVSFKSPIRETQPDSSPSTAESEKDGNANKTGVENEAPERAESAEYQELKEAIHTQLEEMEQAAMCSLDDVFGDSTSVENEVEKDKEEEKNPDKETPSTLEGDDPGDRRSESKEFKELKDQFDKINDEMHANATLSLDDLLGGGDDTNQNDETTDPPAENEGDNSDPGDRRSQSKEFKELKDQFDKINDEMHANATLSLDDILGGGDDGDYSPASEENTNNKSNDNDDDPEDEETGYEGRAQSKEFQELKNHFDKVTDDMHANTTLSLDDILGDDGEDPPSNYQSNDMIDVMSVPTTPSIALNLDGALGSGRALTEGSAFSPRSVKSPSPSEWMRADSIGWSESMNLGDTQNPEDDDDDEHVTKETTTVTTGTDDEGNKIINQYAVIHEIGRGMFGKVKLVVHNETQQLFALKIINKRVMSKGNKGSSRSPIQDIQREIAVMKKLRHVNLVRLYEFMEDVDDGKIYLVMEYVEGGAIRQICDDGTLQGDSMTPEEAQNAMRQIVAGLTYLRSHNVVHRDLKPENILMHQGIVKICDFGKSIQVDDSSVLYNTCQGTPAFMAPEACRGDPEVNGFALDMWALGVTLWMLLFGNNPFHASSYGEMVKNILGDTPVIPEPSTPEIRDVMQGLLEKDPKRRFTLENLRKHPFITGKGSLAPVPPHCASSIHLSPEDIEGAIKVGHKMKLADKFMMLAKLRNTMHSHVQSLRKKRSNTMPTAESTASSPTKPVNTAKSSQQLHSRPDDK